MCCFVSAAAVGGKKAYKGVERASRELGHKDGKFKCKHGGDERDFPHLTHTARLPLPLIM